MHERGNPAPSKYASKNHTKNVLQEYMVLNAAPYGKLDFKPALVDYLKKINT